MNFLPQRHYPNAPITEAVIDLMVTPEAEPSLDALESMRDDGYPKKEAIRLNQVQFTEGTATTTQATMGWRFRSDDGAQVYQVRRNGFGASRLTPYQNWQAFNAEARRLWSQYRKATRPTALKRLGLRYINRIDIPLPLDDFGEYLLTAPVVSPHLPQGLSNYVMNLTIPLDDDVTAVVTEAVLNQQMSPSQNAGAQATPPNTVSILLDIDVSQVSSLSVSEDQIWERFELLRRFKNHVFESCITDKTRELFE